jgi:RNA polymerase sigma factor (sigma-70 family)
MQASCPARPAGTDPCRRVCEPRSRGTTLVDVVTDDELLARWRGGDAKAAGELFERHFDGLYRFFGNKVDAAADDLVQRTFLGCFEGRDRFRGECSFRTYLFAVARNQLLAHFARQRGSSVEPEHESVVDTGVSPSSAVHHRREHALVLAALRRIPIDHQILLELFYWEEQSGPELAEILGVPEGTIRTRLRRARQQLAEAIGALGAQPALVHSTLSTLEDWARSLRPEPPEPGER